MNGPIVVKSTDVRHTVREAIVQRARVTFQEVTLKLSKLGPKQQFERRLLETSLTNAEETIHRSDADKLHRGWRTETYYLGTQQQVRLISPDGERYVRVTHGSERVDVILRAADSQFDSHWKSESDASVTKRARKEARLIKQAKKAKAAKRADNKQRKEVLNAASDVQDD